MTAPSYRDRVAAGVRDLVSRQSRQRIAADWDVPLKTVEDQVAEIAAEKAARIAAGVAAEQRHLLCDADPDSAVPPFPYLIKSRTERGAS